MDNKTKEIGKITLQHEAEPIYGKGYVPYMQEMFGIPTKFIENNPHLENYIKTLLESKDVKEFARKLAKLIYEKNNRIGNISQYQKCCSDTSWGLAAFFTNNLSEEDAIAYINNRSGSWSENFTLREVLSYY